jgi:hypothetical protein
MLVAGAFFVFGLRPPIGRVQNEVAAGTNSPLVSSNHAAVAGAPSVAPHQSLGESARQRALFASFQKHPFAAVKTNSAFGWTSEDGTRPEIMRQLAHNELELERMADESDRIYRRQLVYHTDTVAAQIERSKLTGEPLLQLQLPGLDGQEIQFNITAADLSPSGQQGTFAGQLAGQPDSMVTFAFKGGREAFTLFSPTDHTYLVGEPREPGEVIVKSLNITNYTAGRCGEP